MNSEDGFSLIPFVYWNSLIGLIRQREDRDLIRLVLSIAWLMRPFEPLSSRNGQINEEWLRKSRTTLSLPGSHDSELRGGKERWFATYPSYFTVANSEDEEQIKASKESHGKVLPLPSSHYFFDLGSRPRCLSSATSHDTLATFERNHGRKEISIRKLNPRFPHKGRY